MNKTLVFGALPLLLTAAACGSSPSSDGDDPESEAVAYILFENSALQAGFAFEGYDEDELRVPIEVDAGALLEIATPDGELELELEQDELVVLRRDDEPLRGILGKDFARNRLRVVGNERAARGIARLVGGDIIDLESVDGEMYRSEDEFVVKAPDVFAEAAAAWAPDGLEQLSPVELAPHDRLGGDSIPDAAPPALLSNRELMAGRALARGASLLPAQESLSGFASLTRAPATCSDPVAGTWISREYYEEYGDWYMFSLHVDRNGKDKSQLMGTISSRSWSGAPGAIESAECGSLPSSNWGEGFDWTVMMQAEGRVQGQSFSFEGKSWAPKSARCGQAPRAGSYNLDRFQGSLVEGRWIRALNNDGDRSVDDPHTFQRVSCSSR